MVGNLGGNLKGIRIRHLVSSRLDARLVHLSNVNYGKKTMNIFVELTISN